MYLCTVRIASLGVGLPKSISAQPIHFAMATEKGGGRGKERKRKRRSKPQDKANGQNTKRQRHKGNIYKSNKNTQYNKEIHTYSLNNILERKKQWTGDQVRSTWWLQEGTARLLGCRTNPDEIIRGHIGPTENLRTIFTLVASYIFTTWKERSHQRIPRRQEVENFWELENYFDISTPYIICIICFCLFCRLLPYNEISCCLFIPFLDIVCSPPDLLFILFIFVILVYTRVKMK